MMAIRIENHTFGEANFGGGDINNDSLTDEHLQLKLDVHMKV